MVQKVKSVLEILKVVIPKLPSCMEFMEILGYNIHQKSWKNIFLSEKPTHWDQITTLPWSKVVNVLKVALEEDKEPSRNYIILVGGGGRGVSTKRT
jgi:hypothetical protein